MDGMENFISVLDYILDTKRKRHIIGGILVSASLLFGGLALTVMTIKSNDEYDPYNAREFVDRWASENGPFGIEKVIQGAKTESVPLGELKKLSEERMLLFDEDLMTFAMGNCITLEDTNGNRKLLKKRYEQKIDAVAAMMDAYIAYKANKDAFE